MTLTQWEANPEFAKELAEELKKPIMLAALTVLHEQGLRPISPPVGTTFDITQYGAFIGFKRDGYFEALKNLSLLSQRPVRSGKPEPKAWEDVTQPQPPSAQS